MNGYVSGTHRAEYFYSTDRTLPPDRIVSLFTGRWSIEVTFQEVRRHLGFATPRNWSQPSVLRTAPCLRGLFSLVSMIFHRLWLRQRPVLDRDPWYAKKELTFSDALASVRRLCWNEVLAKPCKQAGVLKVPRLLRRTLLDQLCRAA